MLAERGPPTDERVRILLESVSDAVVIATPAGQVLACNSSACRLFGYSAEEMIQLTRTDLGDATDPRLAAAMRERSERGMARSPIRMIRRGGERFDAQLTLVEVAAADGAPQLWIFIQETVGHRDASAVALRDSNEMLRALSDAAFEGVVMHRDGIIQSANRAAEHLAGVVHGALVGRPLFDFIAPESHSMVLAKVAANDDRPYEAVALRADGTTYPVEVRVRTVPVAVSGGSLRVTALRDLTARRQLEEQYRQSQKMEAVGQLAGGIAHDFNNLLSVILGATELAARAVPVDHPSRVDLEAVRSASERAAGLTRQLLAFSRKQVLRARVVDVNEVLDAAGSMIRRLIAEDIELVVLSAPTPAPIVADPGQLELMLMNLALNARDAMPGGGRLTLEARHVALDAATPGARPDVGPGPLVVMAVSDTGAGMDEATQARIFEPFFTTKGPGQGTGLGLAMVFGIVKQSGGDISVRSARGHGSTFEIAFPLSVNAPAIVPAPARSVGVAPDRTLLVVEDEALLRRLIVKVLRRAGYRVLEAEGPLEALALSRSLEEELHGLVTDMVMPKMDGRQLADRLAAERPGLRILFMSGYTQEGIVHDGILDAAVSFLAKPFAPDRLLEAVRAVLAG